MPRVPTYENACGSAFHLALDREAPVVRVGGLDVRIDGAQGHGGSNFVPVPVPKVEKLLLLMGMGTPPLSAEVKATTA